MLCKNGLTHIVSRVSSWKKHREKWYTNVAINNINVKKVVLMGIDGIEKQKLI